MATKDQPASLGQVPPPAPSSPSRFGLASLTLSLLSLALVLIPQAAPHSRFSPTLWLFLPTVGSLVGVASGVVSFRRREVARGIAAFGLALNSIILVRNTCLLTVGLLLLLGAIQQ